MKALMGFVFILYLSGCESNPTGNKVEDNQNQTNKDSVGTTLYKFVNKDVFNNDVFLSVEFRTDTVLDDQGYLRVMEMPTVYVWFDNPKVYFPTIVGYMVGGDSIHFNAVAFIPAGEYDFSEYGHYYFDKYEVKNTKWTEFHVLLRSNYPEATVYFKAGIKIK